jgi:hypothetical protein
VSPTPLRIGTVVGLAILAIGMGPASRARAEGGSDGSMRNAIEGLRRISVADTYEGKPILSLQEVLRHLGTEESGAFLSGISGEAFIFTYVAAPIDEPQRDHWPHDVFARAAAAVGSSVTWRAGLGQEEVKQIVREQIDMGRPVLTHSLDTSRYHGFQIIAGYDYAKGTFLLQTADRYDHQDYVEVPIPEEWMGAVPGPTFWAVNPLGLVTPPDPETAPDRKVAARRALAAAVRLWRHPSFPFGEFPAEPGTHYDGSVDLAAVQAPLGAAAFDALEREILTADAVTFRMVWRVDAQLCRLTHNRKDAAAFLREVAPLFEPAEADALARAADVFQSSAERAAGLLACFWDGSLADLADVPAGELRDRIAASSSIVLSLPQGADTGEIARVPGWSVQQTPWGTVVVADSRERRKHAAGLARELMANEAKGFGLLAQVALD